MGSPLSSRGSPVNSSALPLSPWLTRKDLGPPPPTLLGSALSAIPSANSSHTPPVQVTLSSSGTEVRMADDEAHNRAVQESVNRQRSSTAPFGLQPPPPLSSQEKFGPLQPSLLDLAASSLPPANSGHTPPVSIGFASSGGVGVGPESSTSFGSGGGFDAATFDSATFDSPSPPTAPHTVALEGRVGARSSGAAAPSSRGRADGTQAAELNPNIVPMRALSEKEALDWLVGKGRIETSVAALVRDWHWSSRKIKDRLERWSSAGYIEVEPGLGGRTSISAVPGRADTAVAIPVTSPETSESENAPERRGRGSIRGRTSQKTTPKREAVIKIKSRSSSIPRYLSRRWQRLSTTIPSATTISHHQNSVLTTTTIFMKFEA
jgi:hypothetical protein